MDIKELMKCDCGEKGEIFYCQGQVFWGHYCQNTKRWRLKDLPTPDFLTLYKEKYGL